MTALLWQHEIFLKKMKDRAMATQRKSTPNPNMPERTLAGRPDTSNVDHVTYDDVSTILGAPLSELKVEEHARALRGAQILAQVSALKASTYCLAIRAERTWRFSTCSRNTGSAVSGSSTNRAPRMPPRDLLARRGESASASQPPALA